MRPLRRARYVHHFMFAASGAITLAISVAVALALGCGQDATGNRISSTTARGERKQPEVKMPHELWVTSQDSSVLFIRNFEDLSPIGEIRLPANAGPHITTFTQPHFAYIGGITE